LKEIATLKTRLTTQLSMIENKIKNAPDGALKVSIQRNIPRYYHSYSNNAKPTKYISRKYQDLAQQLAQKDYYLDLIPVLQKQIDALNKFENDYDGRAIANVYEKLSEVRQQLVNPIELSDEEYCERWLNNKQNQKEKNPNSFAMDMGITTRKGEMVRSKSEKLIADKLFMRKIPYVYETPLTLARGSIIYPDFTILNVRTRETFYLEHFGMMDNSDYCKKALEKIDLYEANSIYLGEKLLVSFESSTKGIHMLQIDSIIDRLLI